MSRTSYQLHGTTALLTIERPERRNAVDAETAAELLEAFRRFEADESARALVLTGAGELAFCAGADLKALAEAGPEVPADVVDRVAGRAEGPMGFTRLTSDKPTIAAISGWCLAGGLELALWCDLRIATPDARLGYPERRWGVPLIDGGTLRLPRIVGLGRALDLILTGRIIEAPEALEWGPAHRDRRGGAPCRARRPRSPMRSPAFPQETMLSDRRSAIEGATPPARREPRVRSGDRPGLDRGRTQGAGRFAGGEGRGGAGAGV